MTGAAVPQVRVDAAGQGVSQGVAQGVAQVLGRKGCCP